MRRLVSPVMAKMSRWIRQVAYWDRGSTTGTVYKVGCLFVTLKRHYTTPTQIWNPDTYLYEIHRSLTYAGIVIDRRLRHFGECQ